MPFTEAEMIEGRSLERKPKTLPHISRVTLAEASIEAIFSDLDTSRAVIRDDLWKLFLRLREMCNGLDDEKNRGEW